MEKADTSTWKETLIGESLLFGLLGKALYTAPDRDWLDGLIRDNIFSEVVFGEGEEDIESGFAILRQWSQAHPEGLSDEAYTALENDYLNLFIGPGPVVAPPWESVYFSDDGLLFQPRTLEVRAYYRQFGLEMENLYQEPDDHIALEISFVAYLATLALQALETQNEETFTNLQTTQCQFLSRHLLTWGTSWCALVNTYAKTDFYQGLGLLVSGALAAVAKIYDLQVTQAAL